jgi:hypothetical protein
VLERSTGAHRSVRLADDADVPFAIIEHMLSSFVRSFDPLPGAVDGVVLVPAGGVCGAASAGPVDAIRNEGLVRADADGVPCRVRVLGVQQTRCWLLAATLWPGTAGPPRIVPGPRLRRVEDVVAADTARATQYMQDRGLGSDWPGLLMFGEPHRDVDGTLRTLIAFTDADYATALIDSLLDEKEIREKRHGAELSGEAR